jgi:hypothetical protein
MEKIDQILDLYMGTDEIGTFKNECMLTSDCEWDCDCHGDCSGDCSSWA